MRDNSSLYFWFLKALHLHVPNQTKHNYDSQRIRSVLMIVLCWISNAERIQKWNTWSKPHSHIPFTHFHDYFLFLMTWYACIAVWDSHTDVNYHLGDTWLLWFFENLDNWTSSADGFTIFNLSAYLLFSLDDLFWCVEVLMLASPEYLWWVGL